MWSCLTSAQPASVGSKGHGSLFCLNVLDRKMQQMDYRFPEPSGAKSLANHMISQTEKNKVNSGYEKTQGGGSNPLKTSCQRYYLSSYEAVVYQTTRITSEERINTFSQITNGSDWSCRDVLKCFGLAKKNIKPWLLGLALLARILLNTDHFPNFNKLFQTTKIKITSGLWWFTPVLKKP